MSRIPPHFALPATLGALAYLAACAQAPDDASPPAETARLPLPAADTAANSGDVYPFMDPSLSPEARARDVVSRMTLEEKSAQLYDKAAAIPRLGLHEYNWWNEALHGVARAGEATVFPQAIGLAATWDEDLMLDVATVISDEGRAKHHFYASEDVHAMYGGLTFWSPNINIFRDPRWGRGQETYGEDPYLTGRMAVNFINGMQGEDDTYLKTVATVKHFAVHSGPEPSRHRDDYTVSETDLRETYLPAFAMAIEEADVASVMCAYNAVWGAPACGSERLMVDILRGELGFDGYVVSDCGAIGDFYYDHAHDHVETRAEAAALAIRMGTDLNCGDGEGNKMDALPEAVALGLIDEATIDRAVERLYTALFRLGMYDDPARVPHADLPLDVVASPSHLQLSEDAARKSLVLLKNNGILPLEPGTRVAVIGPNADNWWTLVANYYGRPTAPVTALEGIINRIGDENVFYSAGSTLAGDIHAGYEVIPASVLFHETADGRLQPGLQGAYYADKARTGDPVLERVDAEIDFAWTRTPGTDLLNDEFGATWTGAIIPDSDGTYRFRPSRWSRVLVDGVELGASDEVEMKAGEHYALRVEFSLQSGWPRDGLDKFARLEWVDVSRDLRAEALAAAEAADVILYFGGIDANLEGEEMPVEIDGFLGGDRTHLKLPESQQDLLRALEATDKPIVMVNFSGSAMALNRESRELDAIVQAFYPGERAGEAISDLLWGDFSPSGRLPVTFYKSVEDLPDFGDYNMTNRTYKYFEGRPLYAFGHGLSYTTFAYSGLEMPSAVAPGADFPLAVSVTNTGDRAGREVVQVYLTRETGAQDGVPRRKLVAFDVVDLQPGETRIVHFTIDGDSLGYFNTDGHLVFTGQAPMDLSVGGGQPGFTPATVSGFLTIDGE